VSVFLLANERHWACPRCGFEDVTYEPDPHSRFHNCRALAGLSTPMVPADIKAKVSTVEREDYIAGDMVQTDGNGRPVMATVIEREDGEDRAVYAPCATASLRE
jgi:hypothetical protein